MKIAFLFNIEFNKKEQKLTLYSVSNVQLAVVRYSYIKKNTERSYNQSSCYQLEVKHRLQQISTHTEALKEEMINILNILSAECAASHAFLRVSVTQKHSGDDVRDTRLSSALPCGGAFSSQTPALIWAVLLPLS